MTAQADVVILGGGLAALSLAIQLRSDKQARGIGGAGTLD